MSRVPIAFRLRAFIGGPLRRRMRVARHDFLKVASGQCRDLQLAVLQDLLRLNQGSVFSRDYGLSPGMSLSDFRSRIPVADYELVRPYIERVAAGEHSALLGEANRLLMFAVTSGTTAESKLIPVTERFLNDYRQGWQMWGIGTYTEHARLQKLNIVQISSSHRKFTSADGTPCGNISGLVAAMQNPIVRTLYTIPAAVAEIPDPESRRRIIVRMALTDPFIGMLITANPSTLVQLWEYAVQHHESLFDEIAAGGPGKVALPPAVMSALKGRLRANPRRANLLRQAVRHEGSLLPSTCWPGLGVLGVWCGGSAAAYIPRLKQIFGSIPIRDHGLHASEGRMTLPLHDDCPAGVLEVKTHFFEFLPIREEGTDKPVVLEAHELEEGQEYFILLTTSSGLYRYNIRDVVRCVGFHGTTPLLEFRHKGSHISSITGEKITESQVVESVNTVSDALGLRLRLFTLTPRWSEPPGYVLYLLPDDESMIITPSVTGAAVDKLAAFADAVDFELRRRNLEYTEKRETGRLSSIKAIALASESWQLFARNRQSKAGGSAEQYKHPCLVPDPEFQSVFLKLCGLK